MQLNINKQNRQGGQRSLLHKQQGSISLLGASVIVLAISALTVTLELGNKLIKDRMYDNYAQSLAPVALHSQLAITESTENRNITRTTLDAMVASVKGNNDNFGNATYKITYGNIVEVNGIQSFEPLKSSENPSNPRGLFNGGVNAVPPDFSAVAIQVSSTGGLLKFQANGKAIYGLTKKDSEDTTASECFCSNRYDSCLSAPITTTAFPGVPADAIGEIGTDKRKNYCEYGYAPARPISGSVANPSVNLGYAKYPYIDFSPEWVGKNEGGRAVRSHQDNFEIVNAHKPLRIEDSKNPFSKTWNFFSFKLETDGVIKAHKIEKPSGWFTDLVLEKSDIPSGIRDKGYYSYGTFSLFSGQKVKVNDSFYIGRSGTCTKDSGDLTNFKTSYQDGVHTVSTNPEVQRCLSYRDDTTGTVKVPCGKFDMSMACWLGGGMKTVTVTEKRYYQQSCIDFNRQEATKVNFFQWMMMSWTWKFKDYKKSYESLNCVTKSMTWHGSFLWSKRGWSEQE